MGKSTKTEGKAIAHDAIQEKSHSVSTKPLKPKPMRALTSDTMQDIANERKKGTSNTSAFVGNLYDFF